MIPELIRLLWFHCTRSDDISSFVTIHLFPTLDKALPQLPLLLVLLFCCRMRVKWGQFQAKGAARNESWFHSLLLTSHQRCSRWLWYKGGKPKQEAAKIKSSPAGSLLSNVVYSCHPSYRITWKSSVPVRRLLPGTQINCRIIIIKRDWKQIMFTHTN